MPYSQLTGFMASMLLLTVGIQLQAQEIAFIRGDVNGDVVRIGQQTIDLTDAVHLLNYLFRAGPEPIPVREAGNIDDAADINLSDAVYLLSYLFCSGSPPPEPFLRLGLDPTPRPCELGVFLTRAPYLQALTANSARLRLKTSCPVALSLQWGEGKRYDQSMTMDEATTFTFDLENLQPDTEYSYRVLYGELPIAGLDSRVELRFRTAPQGPETPVRFLHFADGLFPGRARALYNTPSERPADLLVVAGDLVYSEFARTFTYDQFFYFLAPLTARHPLFAAIGNHDIEAANVAGFTENIRFPSPVCAGEEDPACNSYYSIDYGQAHFAFLNTSVDASGRPVRGGSLTREQADWLRQDLQASSAQWKFIVCHHPPYTGLSEHSSQIEVRLRLETVYEDSPFDAVLAGHNHILYRSKPVLGGTIADAAEAEYVDPNGYIVVVSGALGFGYPYRGDPTFGGWGSETPGVFHGDVSHSTFVGTFYDLDGEELHRFTIRKTTP